MFLAEIRKITYPCKPQFYYIKMGFKGVKIIQACFRDDIFWVSFLNMRLQILFHRKQTGNKSESSHYSPVLNDQGQGHDLVSRSQLCKEQHNDPEILPLLERAFEEKETDQIPVFFYIKNGILMRKQHLTDVSAEDEWTVNHQIVVPRV